MTLGQNVPKLDALHLMDGIEGLRSLPKHSVDMLLTNEAVICGLTPEKACNFKEFAA